MVEIEIQITDLLVGDVILEYVHLNSGKVFDLEPFGVHTPELVIVSSKKKSGYKRVVRSSSLVIEGNNNEELPLYSYVLLAGDMIKETSFFEGEAIKVRVLR